LQSIRNVKSISNANWESVSGRRPDIQLTHPYKNLSEFLGRYKQSNGSETVVELRNGFLHSSDIKLYLPGRTASLSIASLATRASCATKRERLRRQSGKVTVLTSPG